MWSQVEYIVFYAIVVSLLMLLAITFVTAVWYWELVGP
jgi:hypothetical protein